MKEEISRLSSLGYTQQQMARELKTSVQKITKICREYNIGRRRHDNITEEQKKEIRKDYRNGKLIREIVLKFGVDRMVISRICKDLIALKRNDINLRNEKVIMMYKSGLDITKIANIISLSTDHTRNILKTVPNLYTPYSCRSVNIKPSKLKTLKKMKKAKEIVPAEISRDLLNKGFERGAVEEVKLREDRDAGRLVKLMYSNVSDIPSKVLEIRVKDDVSDLVACERWANRMGVKSWAVC